jgi:ketosteroid isomerase-like protein
VDDESAKLDLVELTRRSMEASNRRDFDAALAVFAADAVFDMSAAGIGRFEGLPAVRRYLEDWIGLYERQEFARWEGEHCGGGIVFVEALLDATLSDTAASVQEAWAFTVVWRDGSIASVTATQQIAAARAAARAAGQRAAAAAATTSA